jgi:hypothetical protein
MPLYASPDKDRTWQAPSMFTKPAERKAFCVSMKQVGEQWVQAQSAYRDIPKAIDALTGQADIPFSETRSGINTARLKRDAREIIGTLANIRPFWGYSSDAEFFRASAGMMNKVARAVYLESFFDRALKGALQYAMATGDGYIWPKYTRSMYGRGRGSINFDYLGSLDVLPVQMPRSNNLQEAYIVTIGDFVPVAKAHSMFPQFQDQLIPIAKRKYRGSSTNTKRLSLAEKFRFGARKDSFMELYSEINYQFILDNSVNTTGSPLPMGQPGTSWFYTVPNVGDEIRTKDPLTGNTYSRAARPEDCYIYPHRRVMIFNDDVLLYDGPAWDWHDMVPLLRFSLDRWAWEGTGLVLLKDGYEYQYGINQLERAAQTVANSRLRPGLTYDMSAGGEMNSQTAEGLDPFAPDVRVGVDSSGGSEKPAFNTILPEHLMEVPEWFFTLMDHYNQGMDYQLGLKDISALAKLRANADASSLDKILEVQGPIVQDISRDMEQPMRDAGEMTKFLILQYYTTKRVMEYVGEDGMTAESFDYDPESLIPSHMPFEVEKFHKAEPSDVPKLERAREFANNLRFTITPYSIHEITATTKKLAYVQLKKAGIWISNQTIAEAWNVPNYGSVGGNTEMEKFWNEKQVELEHMAKLKQIGEGLMSGASGGGMGQVPGAGGGAPVGRPSSFESSPKMKQKGDGRGTVTTSQ